MSRPVKRLLMSLAVVLLVACMWVGWLVLRVHAAAQHVVWQAKEGGLTLSYFPLKDQAMIFVGTDYTQGGTLTWAKTDPGATNWIIAAPVVPAPEVLLGRAWIGKPDKSLQTEPQPHPRYGLMSSSAEGLARFYADASEVQRWSIVDMLENACGSNDSFSSALQHVQALPDPSQDLSAVGCSTGRVGSSQTRLGLRRVSENACRYSAAPLAGGSWACGA